MYIYPFKYSFSNPFNSAKTKTSLRKPLHALESKTLPQH